MKWIQFIDSGGQLQYHDILPLFIQNPGVTVFVFNLSEKLSHHPTMEYYGADGKPVGKPYQSTLSHKQILQGVLQHYYGTEHSQDASNLIVSVVGTHRDVKNKCTETINDKNEQLKALCSPNFRMLYKGESLTEVIFSVNSKDPQDEDRRVAKELVHKIVSTCPTAIQTPIAWFGLEFLIRRSSNNGILSLAECKVYAKRLHMEENAFSAALDHLIDHNVFLYYPEVLPQTVFCDPQVILSKVTELVQYHHKVKYNPDDDVAVEGNLMRFRDHGLLWVELVKKFPAHYKEGLFTPVDLLNLLVHVRAIAMIRDGEYLMPALLSHMECDKVSQQLHQSTPLIIWPKEGCIPSGLFCCLVAHLLSPSNPSHWKVCMDGNKPLHLHRNCISFDQTDATEIITLIDTFSYIEVHVDEPSCEVCSTLRDHIHKSIKSACNVLKYSDEFKDAFVCTGERCTSYGPHVAVVVPTKSSGKHAYKWKCTKSGNQKGSLTEEQLIWFDVSKQASGNAPSPFMNWVIFYLTSNCYSFA